MKKQIVCLCMTGVFILCVCRVVCADELSELKEEMKIMQKQMEVMQKKIEVLEAEKQVRVETPAKMGQETLKPEEKAKDKDNLQALWKNGLYFKTEDGKFDMKIGTRIHTDIAWFNQDSDVENRVGASKDEARFKFARFYVQGRIYNDVLYKLEYDFASGNPVLRDAYLGLTNIPVIGTVKAGHFLEPFGLETLPSYLFLENNLPRAAFYNFYNLGIEARSSAFNERLTYAAGVFLDADDSGHATSNEGNVTGRVTCLPWYENDGERLLHLGISYSFRNPEETLRYRARPEVCFGPFFVDTGNIASGYTNVFSGEGAVVYGPFSLQGEYMGAIVDRISGPSPNYFQGCYVQAAYFLTGEHRPYGRRSGCFGCASPEPIHNFSISDGGIGAWEVAARFSYLDLKDDDISGGILSDITVGLNWYWNPNMGIRVNYIHSHLKESGDQDTLAVGYQIYF